MVEYGKVILLNRIDPGSSAVICGQVQSQNGRFFRKKGFHNRIELSDFGLDLGF